MYQQHKHTSSNINEINQASPNNSPVDTSHMNSSQNLQ